MSVLGSEEKNSQGNCSREKLLEFIPDITDINIINYRAN